MSSNVYNNSSLWIGSGWQNSIQWKGASWQNVVGTRVLNNPGPEAVQDMPFMRSCSSRHPKHRFKRPRPLRGWRKELMPPKHKGAPNGRYNGKGSYTSVDNIPNGRTRLLKTLYTEKGSYGKSPACKDHLLHTTWHSVPGADVDSKYLTNLSQCKVRKVPQVVRIDPYSFTTQEYLRSRRRLYSQNTSNRLGNSCYPICSKTGQNLVGDEPSSQTYSVPPPVVKPLFTSDRSYPVPATYRPGKIGGVSSADRTFALKLRAQKHNPVFPPVKTTPFVPHIKPGNKLKCSYSPAPNRRAPVGFFSPTSSVLG